MTLHSKQRAGMVGVALGLLALGSQGGAQEGSLDPIQTAELQTSLEARGGQLYKAASCVGCHSWEAGGLPHLGGGRPALTEFGTFMTPNISPDPINGIGLWTEDDFFRAMREGRAPDGRRYWPAFPYHRYSQMNDMDIHALWAYLRSQPPVSTPNGSHEVRPPYGAPGLLGLWRALNFEPGPYEPDADHSELWNRGAYVSQAYGYCTECHTPRRKTGALKERQLMAGGINRAKEPVEFAPNLTPDAAYGIGTWTEDDIVTYLDTGVRPDGQQARWVMYEKVHDSFKYLSLEDKLGVAAYLVSLPPLHVPDGADTQTEAATPL